MRYFCLSVVLAALLLLPARAAACDPPALAAAQSYFSQTTTQFQAGPLLAQAPVYAPSFALQSYAPLFAAVPSYGAGFYGASRAFAPAYGVNTFVGVNRFPVAHFAGRVALAPARVAARAFFPPRVAVNAPGVRVRVR